MKSREYVAINEEGYQTNALQMSMGSIAGGQGQLYGWMWAVYNEVRQGGNPHACIYTLACAFICMFACLHFHARSYVHLHACL